MVGGKIIGMKKLLGLVVLCLLICSSSFAKEINVDINGLFCDCCAATIEKSFKNMDEVLDVKVDKDKNKLFLTFEDDKDLADEEITDIIKNGGYTATKINR